MRQQPMEKRLSWIALLFTAFYSLLANCRGEECGPEELVRCSRPLEKFSYNNNLGLGTLTATKEELEQICPDFEKGMRCIHSYSQRCLRPEHRKHFHSLYGGVNLAIKELCQEGPHQDEFLRHAPCMQKVHPEYESCARKYQSTMQTIEAGNRLGSSAAGAAVKSICCALQVFLDCSHDTVQKKCGDETAKFTKEFLDRMSGSLMTAHCPYTHKECADMNGSASLGSSFLIPLTITLLAAYLT